MWFPWSDSIKTRLCRFLLHHYIGHFLEEKLSLEQMSVELYAGKGTIHNVALNTETLNELLDQLNLPFEITEGYISCVSIDIPWSALVSCSTSVTVEGLEITLQPKVYCSTVNTSMMDSVRNMTSSLVLAQQVMEEEVGDTKLEGLEAFAHMIESVLSRVKCSFTNTAIRLQSCDPHQGTALELVVDKVSYFDESDTVDPAAGGDYIPTSIAHKVILLSGISLRLSETPTNQNYLNKFKYQDQEEHSTETESTVIAKLLGEQEIKIHLKINDQLPGPKLDMECKAGSIHFMLSPHQVHSITDLIHDVNSTLSDSRKEAAPHTLRSKKMSNDDFARVEQELHLKLNKQRAHQHSEGSSSDEFFYSMHSAAHHGNQLHHGNNLLGTLPQLDLPPLVTELHSIPLSSLDPHDTAPAQSTQHMTRHPQHTAHSDLPEDFIVVQIHVRYVSVTLLHQNLTAMSVNHHLSQPMSTLSTAYFSEVAGHVTNNYEHDETIVRECLKKVCPHDHLLCVSVNTQFRLELLTSPEQVTSSVSLSVIKCELEECLYSSLTETRNSTPSHQPVLLLDQKAGVTGYLASSPALSLVTKSVTTNDEYRTSCALDLGSVSLIADITMSDRVGVLHKPKYAKHGVHMPTVPGQDLNTASMVRQDIYDQVMVNETATNQYKETFLFNGTCSNVCVTFRFPIPDMRPPSQRTWWAPSLRADYIVIHVTDIDVEHSKLGPSNTEVDVQFAKLNCDYLENSDSEPISFLLTSQLPDEDPATAPKPKIKISVSPTRDYSPLLPNPPSPPPSLDNILTMSDKRQSPFAAKKVMYENQELIIPGSKEEMSEFEEETKSNTRVALDFDIPELLIYLQDKLFFEVLYNRIFTDLLLWSPGCPVIQDTNLTFEQEIFKMCTSSAHRESDSDDDDDMIVPGHKTSSRGSSWLSLSVDIHQGRISLNSSVPPTPEESPLHKNPVGELLIELIDTHVFSVVEYQGDPNTSFFSMSSEGGTVYHGTVSDMTLSSSTLTNSSIHSSLKEILGALPPRLAQDLPPAREGYGFLSIASKVFFDQEKNIKEITLAAALQNVCHRYYMLPPNENYASQIIEFFNVQDYNVPGYKLPLSVTSLHTHLWNFAMDYRPVHLPWKLLVTVQSLGISSNLALESAVTSLRVLLEDLSLYLAPSSGQGVLNKDYVKLLELDLFELVIKMLLHPHDKVPQLDIETKNNMLHIKTCADSCAALRDLIVYFTSEGDLHPPLGDESPSDTAPQTTRIREYSSSDDVPSLVKSAVNTSDEELNRRSSQIDLNLGTKPALPHKKGYSKQTFTFPGDGRTEPVNPTVCDLANAVADVSEDVPLSVSNPHSASLSAAMLSAIDDEEDFFVVESELVETTVAKGQFIIKKLTEGPHVIVEDHFTIPDDSDQLKAPSHFPVPLSRITVKEISLLWHIYGGNDFPVVQTPPSESSRSNPSTPRSERYGSESPRERKHSRDQQKQEKQGRNKQEKMEFQISKMKVRVEQYPEHAQQNFRLCLIVTDIEIKDKMGSSNFNKFLYQYSTEDNPRPSRTPTACVKVVHNKTEERSDDAIIRVSVLPLRFNIDQDALVFLFTFFNNMSEFVPYKRPRSLSAGKIRSSPIVASTAGSNISSPIVASTSGSNRSSPIVASTTSAATTSFSLGGKSAAVIGKSNVCAVASTSSIHSNHGDLGNNTSYHGSRSQGNLCGGTERRDSNLVDETSEVSPVFIKAFVFAPDVPIRVDYKGKSVRGDKNLISNPVTNLLVGLAQLNCSELRLRSLCYRQGLLGYSRLLEWVVAQWINDIKTTQLPSILGGVGPMHSFIQLFSGVVDLVYLPVQQYREDGRIVKGLQRGANSFTHSTAVSLLQLTSKLFSSIQCVAEVTYDLVSPIQHRKSSPSYHQPTDLREGLVNAYEVVTSDISSRASSIQHAAVYNHSTKGITSAIGGVLRELPPTLLLPFITLPKVITQLSNGAQNHLKPSTLKEREEKYRHK